jgi:peroxiredoxin
MVLSATLSLLLVMQPIGWDFHLMDDHGSPHSTAEWKNKRAIVMLFVSTECPISNRYAPTINRMVQDYSSKAVAFYIVQSDPDLTPAQAEKHAEEFALTMPVLMDPKQVLASKLQVLVTPTAIVMNPSGEVRYRGRVDDRTIDLGKYRDVPKREDLKIALDEILAGKPVSEATTKVIGCFLPPPKKGSL